MDHFFILLSESFELVFSMKAVTANFLLFDYLSVVPELIFNYSTPENIKF